MMFSLQRHAFPEQLEQELADLRRIRPNPDPDAQQRAHAALVAMQARRRAKEAGDEDERFRRYSADADAADARYHCLDRAARVTLVLAVLVAINAFLRFGGV